jgi:hypothetical protein
MQAVKKNRAAAVNNRPTTDATQSPSNVINDNTNNNTNRGHGSAVFQAALWLLMLWCLVVLVWLVMATPDAGLLVGGEW